MTIMVTDWTSTTQFIVFGMGGFCISFGVIYSLILCYKSRRRFQDPDENERLREELLKERPAITRRKSTSLTSPPGTSGSSNDAGTNPNSNPTYTQSPFKVPQRHLRSTSATYSPTHYLSPHHRRNSNSTPTQQGSDSACSYCGCPRGINTNSGKSAITSTSSSSSPIQEECTCNDDFHTSHKHKLIPVISPRPKSKSKLALEEDGKSKCFMFGPIPKAKKERKLTPPETGGNGNIVVNKSPSLTLTIPTFTQPNINIFSKEWEEKQPLIKKERNEKNENEKEESKRKPKNNNSKTSSFVKKEKMIMNEIPYYIEQMNPSN